MQIDAEFRSLIPPLSPDEYEQLEANIVAEGCRDALVTWGDVLIDGHNRYEICMKHGIAYETCEHDGLVTREEVLSWIIRNQLGRRNISNYDRARLALRLEPIIAAKAEQRMKAGVKLDPVTNSSQGKTREKLAKIASVAEDTIKKVKVIEAKATPEVKAKLSSGDMHIHQAYTEIRKAEKKEENVRNLESFETKTAKEIKGVYDVIVIDPPWPMKKIERDVRPNQSEFDYPTMTEEELEVLNIPCADDAHVWVWTTHKFLPMAFRLLSRWGLKYVCIFVWHKPGGFQPIGLPQYNCEFAIYARKGSPSFVDTKTFNTCFNAPRGSHSEKPEEFYEVVRRVTGGRRLDMFNRREIPGFDTWGNEAC